jgi:DNA anti-recombination protein RmuC|tara:strand:+ start:417 stop:647 length:231 start_codon:yes stop_codon:yes gene_type:complete
MLSEEVGHLHRRLLKIVAEEEKASGEVRAAEDALKAAMTRRKQSRGALLSTLETLRVTPMSVRALEKTNVGVSVNK